jgi:FHA domain
VTDRLPHLVLSGPEGDVATITLTRERTTIGRLRELNDVALEPDPQQLITRQVHCVVEREGGIWWVVDNGSVNGTFLRRGEDVTMVTGRAHLVDGDVVRVLARLTESGDPLYWNITFVDPLKTQPAGEFRRRSCVEYDWVQARLLLVEAGKRTEIKLRAQEQKLVRYMAQRHERQGAGPLHAPGAGRRGLG